MIEAFNICRPNEGGLYLDERTERKQEVKKGLELAKEIGHRVSDQPLKKGRAHGNYDYWE